MTRSKSPSLASIQGTRPSSGRSYSWFSYPDAPQESRALQNLLMAFVWKPYYLLFVSFLPSSFKHPCPPAFVRRQAALSQARRIIYPFCFFCQYPFLLFLTFFSSFLRRKLSFRRALLGRNGNHSITQHKNCQYLFAVFFHFLLKTSGFNVIK
jgi:hypothetical protein